MNFDFYVPNSIRIPNHLSIRRNLRGYRNSKRPEVERLTLFDRSTVFYDVVYLHDEKRIVALGPQWLNLKRHLLPLKIFINNQQIEFQLTEVEKICFLQSNPIGCIENSKVECVFQFPMFNVQFQIDPRNSKGISANASDERLSMTTLQKDNHVQWVEDWILWYYRLFGVKRLILYDNGSSNRDSLVERIRSLDVDMEVVFVDWPFEYGSTPDFYTQRGSLNHCRMGFAVRGGYCINVDIDEYLVFQGERTLLEYLDDVFQSSKVGSIRMREHLIPKQAPRSTDALAITRVFDHQFYRLDQGIRPRSRTKYIYQFDRIVYNCVHHAVTSGKESDEKTFSWRERVIFTISNHRKWIAVCIGLPRKSKIFLRTYFVSSSELFYFHFRGMRHLLTDDNEPEVEEFDTESHREEPRINEWCRRAGIVPRD